MKNKQTLKTKTKKQTKNSSPNQTNQIPVWSQTSMCSPSLLRHQIRTQPGAEQPQQGGPYTTPGCRARAPPWGGAGAREGKRECASLPACTPCPGPAKTGHSLWWRGWAQNHPPSILFQKVKEKGPEQPYTKYSVASSKGCTEFLASCSTECVPVLCLPLSPGPQLSPPWQGVSL